jgi:poly(3-hydroxybutyrate) depolymerase
MENTAEDFTHLLSRFGTLHPPTMSYQLGEDIIAWQQRFGQQLQALRSPLPPRDPVQVELISSVEEIDHVRQRLHIRVSEYSTLPANLLLPNTIQSGERHPALLVLHGHESDINAICGDCDLQVEDHRSRAYALAAVQAGYIVLAPSLWGWQGREGHVERVGKRDKCNVIQMAASMYGINVVDLHIQDMQAALDVVAGRVDVDEGRIGCLGNSTGGRMTMWLSIFDQRIKACVSSGSMNTFRERSLKLASCAIQYPFGLLRYGDVADLFCLLAPRPMQLQAGELDGLITAADRDVMYQTVQSAYSGLGAEQYLDYVLHEEGHILLWEQANAFLTRYLR